MRRRVGDVTVSQINLQNKHISGCATLLNLGHIDSESEKMEVGAVNPASTNK